MTDESEELKALTQNHLANIVWPLRSPKEGASYIHEFANHIKNKFNEPSPNKYSRELNEFSNLRNIAISTLSENSVRDASSLKALKKYYCQLVSILNRFRDCNAEFGWKNSFGRGSNEGNLDFELNNVMFNIAAIHNEFGSRIVKTNETTTKDACLHFSNALWWIKELRDNRTKSAELKEMGHDLLTFYFHVLQAQAQECILLHSLRAGMKPENVAKIAAQVTSDYDVAAKLAHTPLYKDPLKEIVSGGSSVFLTWRATVEFKHNYFMAITQLLLGLAKADDSASEIGTRIVRLKCASQSLEQCRKLINDTLDSKTTRLAFTILENLVTSKLDKAVRYNENVYHAMLPSRESLPQPEAKLLVSPAAFSIASIPEFHDLFSSLVTIESVQVNSIYSQRKDELARQMSTQVEKQDEELAQMMSTLNIDKKSLHLPSVEVPDELMEICAELSMNPNVVDDVLTKLEELDDKSEEVQKMLDAVEVILRQRPNEAFKRELVNLKTTHETALRSTQSLHSQLKPEIQQNIQAIATTNNPIELLPKVDKISSGDEEVIRKLDKLIDKVDEMKQQRSTLLSQLRQALNDDDVIKHVVAASNEQELKSVFDKEIQKHNKYLQPLQSNLSLQNEILDTLERVNAQFGQVKLNYRAQSEAYKKRVESLKKYNAQFKAISEGIDDGLRCYKSLTELVRNLYSKVQADHAINDLLN